MERHKCKLCSKVFTNGRALGGHMRSHLANLPIPPKTPPKTPQIGRDRVDSASSLSSTEEEEGESEEKALFYGLRENPKKSFRLVDPEFLDAGSVVQDGESETESPRNPTRQRSKRTRRMGFAENHGPNKPPKPNPNSNSNSKVSKPSSNESTAELEQASSVSDTSPEEDVAVALWLIMLSRDTWSSDEYSTELKPSQRKFQCETCKKVFRSSQALGGHRTSHKNDSQRSVSKSRSNADHERAYECPICHKVFGSGQALGGHKRSHFLISSAVGPSKSGKFGESLIDLNLPAPMEDVDLSPLEVSAVSDAEFTNPT